MSNENPTPPPVKPSAPPPESPADLKKRAEAKIVSLETQLKSFEGKNGYNPFLWKRDNKWDSLVAGVNKGDSNSIAKVLALPSTVAPTVKNEVATFEPVSGPLPPGNNA